MLSITKRSVLLSIGFCGAIVMTSGVAGTVWFVRQNWHAESATASTAKVEFDQLRARFAGEAPLLDMQSRKPRTDINVARVQAPLHTFHTVIFDTRGGERLVHITVPYWFGRHYARHNGKFVWLGELTFFDDTEFDPEKIQLSLDEVGPAHVVERLSDRYLHTHRTPCTGGDAPALDVHRNTERLL